MPTRPDATDSLLSVRGLHVAFRDEEHDVEVLGGVDFDVAPGATLGLVGESGCGKSVTALAIMGLLPRPVGQITAGSVVFEGRDLTQIARVEMAKLRGSRLAMIFQEPMTALNPVQRVGRQVEELLQLHRPALSAPERRRQALTMFERVGIPAPSQRLDEYPHQLSGGMRQRVMIAMALSLQPSLLIADEPTTALDVTIQAQILDLIAQLQRDTGMAVLLITHDLGVIAESCTDVVVMYAGHIAERGSVSALFAAPRHPYSQGLIASMPHIDAPPKSRLPTIAGMVPPLNALPAGCRFSNRCPHARPLCSASVPQLEAVVGGKNTTIDGAHVHTLACHRWREIS